jgi:3-oxoacyl-(acyl-carrier-protein) synthase
MPSSSSRVVVTGLGVVAPNATGIAAFEQALRDSRSGLRLLPELAEAGLACQIAGKPELSTSPLDKYVSQEQKLYSNAFLDYLIRAGLECWFDAGFDIASDGLLDTNTGVLIGSVFGGTIETTVASLVPTVASGDIRQLGSTICERIMGSAGSARLAGLLGCGGPTFGSSNACTSGADAILLGYQFIKHRTVKRMLVGGAEGFSPHINAVWDAMRVSTRSWNHAPSQASRPLSATASGFAPGSGAGVLMLEDYETARDRGAKIYAEVLGGHMNSGGQRGGGTIFRANYEATGDCIRRALISANVQPEEVDLINGHFTSTKADPHEFLCWKNTLGGKSKHFPVVTATKSMIGHAIGASGALETIATVLLLRGDFAHGNLNCEDLHPQISDYSEFIPRKILQRRFQIAAKAAFGFGDVNCCLLLKKLD